MAGDDAIDEGKVQVVGKGRELRIPGTEMYEGLRCERCVRKNLGRDKVQANAGARPDIREDRPLDLAVNWLPVRANSPGMSNRS
jgi:hypothetical protein